VSPVFESLFRLSQAVRYVAIYRHGVLTMAERPNVRVPSSGESDRYEELLVNPTVLTLTRAARRHRLRRTRVRARSLWAVLPTRAPGAGRTRIDLDRAGGGPAGARTASPACARCGRTVSTL